MLPARRLIINADDLGRSQAINEAVVRSHREGVLTSASLMVNGGAFEEAVDLARQHPGLGVGLHLTLVCGRATLTRDAIPGLVDGEGGFSNDPVKSGFTYFVRGDLRAQLEAEIRAQFAKFRATGLLMDHVNGHLNMHLHPVVFPMLLRQARESGCRALRLTRDPFWLNARIAQGHWIHRALHAVIFHGLSARALPSLRRAGIRHTSRVFGLLQNGRVTERYILALLAVLPPGDSELYSHPCLGESESEFDALVSPEVRRELQARQIALIRYQDL